ncbi:serine carboxypeptidase-like 19 [Morus notabilis]|uniref:serine carboxypeptidase-like 19 n=1 Tax=Morus notabilis TaxID=981085 RepID=UPI000CED19D0|nr:serine carboxypeptidase-like 19 [Morus notabilis]
MTTGQFAFCVYCYPKLRYILAFTNVIRYIGVGESEDVQLFYYFVKSERNPEKDPLLLWLNGGPGCSGWSGLVYEIGPLIYNQKIEQYNGTIMPTLVVNPHAWTKISSVIFIDSPVGSGFSYGRTPLASQSGDFKQVNHMVQFLRKWLINHPDFISNPFYISGDSYSGIPIPILAHQISNENEAGVTPLINLQGYAIGNPVTDVKSDDNFEIPFAHAMALISDELYKSLKKNCRGKYKNLDPRNTKCLNNMQAYEKCVSGLHLLHILQPLCTHESQILEEIISGRRSLNEKSFVPDCLEDEHWFSLYWANHHSVRRALGVREGTKRKWQRCDFNLPYHKDVDNTVPYHFNLSSKGYRSLIYSGDHDMRVPFLATQAWIRSLNFPIVDDWRPWIVDGQVGGYTRTYSNRMTFATVKGAGHTTPQYMPRESFVMFKRWIDHELQLAVAVDSDTIQFLPGFWGPLPFHLETGYVGVDESEDVQLFYYFVKSERNPEKDALLLWLNGGPGCSGWSGLVYEIGPLIHNQKIEQYNGTMMPTLVLNPHSWTKVSSIIFIDSPVGTGFSYGRTPLASQSGDFKQVHHMVQFLRKWLINHPDYTANPIYISGDSYSGITIPILAHQISNENEAGVTPLINLQGYAVGNPVTNLKSIHKFEIQFAHAMALISDELYKSLKKNCRGRYNNIDPSNTKCLNDMRAYEKCVSGLHLFHILALLCSHESQILEEIISGRRSLNEKNSAPQCREDEHWFSLYWANHHSVRRALGVREGTKGKWQRCDFDVPYHKDVDNTVPYHFNLSSKGYRSLIYSGDHDLTIPFTETQAWIRSLNFPIVDDWRPWIVDAQVGGYTRTYSNGMTFATVKGGGHTAPQYKPRESFVMFKRWIDHERL